jgi:hypothetical protein
MYAGYYLSSVWNQAGDGGSVVFVSSMPLGSSPAVRSSSVPVQGKLVARLLLRHRSRLNILTPNLIVLEYNLSKFEDPTRSS